VVVAADPALPGLRAGAAGRRGEGRRRQGLIVRDGKATDAATGAAATLPAGAEDVVNNNRVRRELEAALAALQALLARPRRARQGHRRALKDQADEGKLVLIDKAIAAETDAA
jgi:urea transport system permease protein